MPHWLLAASALGAGMILLPFAPWMVMAVWLGMFARRVYVPMMRVFRGRRGVAGTVSVLLLMIVLVPVAALLASVVIDAVALVRELLTSPEGRTVLERLAQRQGAKAQLESAFSASSITDLLMTQGERAWAITKQVAGAATHIVIGLLILVSGMYAVLVQGAAWYAWIEGNAPVPARTTMRLAAAFLETGRGLAVSIVGAGLLQSIIATIAYLAIGVPSALALGLLTLLFSVIPAIGTALVWVPVTAGLAITGQTTAALVLGIIGVSLISTVDNLARPYLARRGALQLPTYVVLVSMFGGVELLGAWGLIMGPLVVRLAKEAVLIRAERDALMEPPPLPSTERP